MVDYPSELPFFESVQGTSYSAPDNVLYTTMDVGPAKSRRRTTAGPRPYSGSIGYMTPDQFADFEEWWSDVLISGSLPFSAINPFTGLESEFRFTAPYKVSSLGGGFSIQADLEILP